MGQQTALGEVLLDGGDRIWAEVLLVALNDDFHSGISALGFDHDGDAADLKLTTIF